MGILGVVTTHASGTSSGGYSGGNIDYYHYQYGFLPANINYTHYQYGPIPANIDYLHLEYQGAALDPTITTTTTSNGIGGRFIGITTPTVCGLQPLGQQMVSQGWEIINTFALPGPPASRLFGYFELGFAVGLIFDGYAMEAIAPGMRC
jgi:hypothetical protein